MFAAWGGRPESKQQTGHEREPIPSSIAIDGGAVPAFVPRDAEGTRLCELTRQFYQNRGDAPAWFDREKPRRQADELVAAVRRADREGLDPDWYNFSAVDLRHGD